MSKPEKVKSSGVACLIDGVLTRRVQTLGSSVDLSREEIKELANAGVVEYISDAPSVSIQIDTNDVGSTDTMALICDSMIDYTIDDQADGPLEGIGRHYVRNDSSNASYRTITESDMLNGYCSILATLNEDGTTAKRTMWMNHCAVTGVSLSYDVNGNAAENYTLAADNKTWFLNDCGNARCYKPVNYQIQWHTTGARFTDLDSCVPDGSTVLALGVNNVILRNHRIGGVTGNAYFSTVAAGEFYCTSVALSTPWFDTTDATTDRGWIVYTPSRTTYDTWEADVTAGINPGWELESSAGALGALRRGNCVFYLYNTNSGSMATSTSAGKALRLQSVSIDVALGEEQLYELGTDGFYGISKNTPVPVTISVSATDSDLEYFAMLTSTAYGLETVRSLTAQDFNGYNSLVCKIYKEKTQTTLLKTISINSMYVSSENFNVSVGDNATNEISFTADNITIAGSGVSITGGINSV